MYIGRPLPLLNVLDGSTPTALYSVESTCGTVTLRSRGYSPRALDEPIACPILSPPPATRALITGAQWSRPPSWLLIFGVRPNSPHITTTTSLSRPRSCRSCTRLATPRSTTGSCFFRILKLLPCVSQPPIANVTQPTPASTSRRAVRNCSQPL